MPTTPGAIDTLYLSAPDVIEIIRRKGFAACVAEVAARIEAEFRRWESFQKIARVANHSRQGSIELMPISDDETYTFKYVNGHPKNTREGLPTVMAFGVLADVDTGAPQLLSELTITTAIRTAATSVVAARALARRNSRTMALIGNGAQSEFQALAFHHLLGIDRLRLYDIDPSATEKLVSNLRAVSNLSLEIAGSAAEAVRGADIVTTLTADRSNATILTADMIEPGQHINGVGGDCPGKTELHPDVLHLGPVFVEFEPQTRIEGDLQQMPADFPATEIWRVLSGLAPGRTGDREVTIFDSVGFALEDYAALHVMRDAALALGIGRHVALIPRATDPKDLFGLLRQAA